MRHNNRCWKERRFLSPNPEGQFNPPNLQEASSLLQTPGDVLDTFLLNTEAQLPLLFSPHFFILAMESCSGNLEGSWSLQMKPVRFNALT